MRKYFVTYTAKDGMHCQSVVFATSWLGAENEIQAKNANLAEIHSIEEIPA